MLKLFKKNRIVVFLSVLLVFLPAIGFAATIEVPFKNILLNENGDATTHLNFNTPRQIVVKTPIKYIEQIEVIHKKGNSLADTDVSLTNIDVVTVGSEVSRVNVYINNTNLKSSLTPFEEDAAAGRKKFDIGYASLAETYDIKIEVIGSSSELLEEKILKVPEGKSSIFKISQKYAYKTAGSSYSLYDLLAGKSLFTDVLVEHNLNELYADVEN